MGELKGVWPEEQPHGFEDVFESREHVSNHEAHDDLLREIRTLTPEEWAELEATPSGVHGRSMAAVCRTLLAVEDAVDSSVRQGGQPPSRQAQTATVRQRFPAQGWLWERQLANVPPAMAELASDALFPPSVRRQLTAQRMQQNRPMMPQTCPSGAAEGGASYGRGTKPARVSGVWRGLRDIRHRREVSSVDRLNPRTGIILGPKKTDVICRAQPRSVIIGHHSGGIAWRSPFGQHPPSLARSRSRSTASCARARRTPLNARRPSSGQMKRSAATSSRFSRTAIARRR
jgi:hypothetical protein